MATSGHRGSTSPPHPASPLTHTLGKSCPLGPRVICPPAQRTAPAPCCKDCARAAGGEGRRATGGPRPRVPRLGPPRPCPRQGQVAAPCAPARCWGYAPSAAPPRTSATPLPLCTPTLQRQAVVPGTAGPLPVPGPAWLRRAMVARLAGPACARGPRTGMAASAIGAWAGCRARAPEVARLAACTHAPPGAPPVRPTGCRARAPEPRTDCTHAVGARAARTTRGHARAYQPGLHAVSCVPTRARPSRGLPVSVARARAARYLARADPLWPLCSRRAGPRRGRGWSHRGWIRHALVPAFVATAATRSC
jgi:hypothetical protein